MAGDDEGLARRNVLGLGVTSLLTDVSTEMILAILPFYATEVLGIQMEALGFIEGAAETVASLLKGVSGKISDKFMRRKPFAILGYGISAFTKPLFGITSTWHHILTVRIADRIGKGIRTAPRDALLASSIEPSLRGRAFGLHRMMDTLGAITGPLISLVMLTYGFSYRTIFFLTIIPGLLAILFLVPVREATERSIERRSNFIEKEATYSAEESGVLTWKFAIFIAAVTIFSLGNFSYAFWLLRSSEAGIPVNLVPLFYTLHNIAYALAALPAGELSDRIGREKVLASGYIAFALACLGFTFTNTFTTAALLLILYGVFRAITDTVQRAMASDLAKRRELGTAFGVLHTAVGLSALPSSTIAGLLWSMYGSWAAFTYGAVLAIISTFLLSIWAKIKS
ncbi:MAG: MFS transporter [Candidatus Methanomethylicota archaeon]|uniref:MFS transporter n=1 Tax=Thermoproteota archaeon TaxID=2056631 RepID=A0A497EUQ5_9CREN|nr:MAG: MFS transporter [Candidatus Verstraetearchaeota archaeon]